jgi:hypothetical protein
MIQKGDRKKTIVFGITLLTSPRLPSERYRQLAVWTVIVKSKVTDGSLSEQTATAFSTPQNVGF